jgi:hypothetical protein
VTADWVAALHRTKERAEGDLMNALLRGRVDAGDQPEPAVVAPVDWDAGPRTPAALPPAGMNDLLRAHVAAHRRQPLPEDYQQ